MECVVRMSSRWWGASLGRSRRFFSKLMLKGKVNAAMRLLNETNSGGVLSLSDVVLEEQARKHLFLNLPMGQL